MSQRDLPWWQAVADLMRQGSLPDLALQAGRLGMWFWDAQAGRILWSPSLERIHGLSVGEFGGTFEDFARDIHPEDRAGVFAAVERAMTTGADYHVEYRILHPSGAERWLEARGRVERNAAREAIGMSGICMDVTERHALALQVQARERQQAAVARLGQQFLESLELTDLFSHATQSIAETLGVEFVAISEPTPDGEHLLLRAGVGWKPTVPIGWMIPRRNSQAGFTLQTKASVIVDDIETEHRFAPPAFLLDHGVRSGATVLIRGQNSIYGVLGTYSSSPVRFTADDVVFLEAVANILAVALDQKQREMQDHILAEAGTILTRSLDLAEMMQLLADLAANSLADWVAVHLFNAQEQLRQFAIAHRDPAKVTWIHQLNERFPQDPLPNSHMWQVLTSDRSELLTNIPDELIDAEIPDEEHRALVKQLGLRSSMIVPLRGRGKILGGMLFVTSDDSGRHFSTRDLAVAEHLAVLAVQVVDNAALHHRVREAASLREDFVALTSHELRGPLTSVLGFASRLRQRARTDSHFDAETREAIDLVATEAERMRRTLNLLVQLAQIEGQGDVPLRIEPVDLIPLLYEEATGLSGRFAQAKVEIPHHSSAQVETDAGLIREILTNLLDNAAKYGGEPPHIVMTLELSPDYVSVAITDNGPGIPEADQPQLFQRRFRGAGGVRGKGLGLGLYVSKALADRVHARITFESQAGKGTIFRVTIPRAMRQPV